MILSALYIELLRRLQKRFFMKDSSVMAISVVGDEKSSAQPYIRMSIARGNAHVVVEGADSSARAQAMFTAALGNWSNLCFRLPRGAQLV
jgi:hypothetical protein